MSEIHTIRYADGRWCEQEYVDDELHGTWTVYHANGRKHWERQHAHGRKEGYLREWDASGRLVEEKWFHLDELHGRWRKWVEAGTEVVVGDFIVGYTRQAFEATMNPDFNALIKPHYGAEPEDFAECAGDLLSALRRPSIRMKKLESRTLGLSHQGSFWGYVNVLGMGEEWPRHRGSPLRPILQINCGEVTLPDNPLAGLSFVTLFAAAGGVLGELGEDIVVRAYRPGDDIVQAEPPCEPLEQPKRLSLADLIISYPDENDLPPGLRIFLKRTEDAEHVLGQEEKLNSRLGGWPGWLQGGRLSGFSRFAFQVDSLDVEGWDCGDCTIHYFFREDAGGFSWCQEMC